MDIVIKIFAILGLVSIVAISLYYIAKALQKVQDERTNADKAPPEWPPYDYMQNIGSVCPTGWAIGKKNIFNNKIKCIPPYTVTENSYSYKLNENDDDDKLIEQNCINRNGRKSFAPINNWYECLNDRSKCNEQMKDRCKFINTCRYDDNTRIPWIGYQIYVNI